MREFKEELFAGLPPDRVGSRGTRLREAIRTLGRKVVVLDDDPTGTQTVHGIPVLTVWDVETLSGALAEPGPGFFILTNSRAVDAGQAETLNETIGRNLVAAREQTGTDFVVISRSDSTLRGHFPLETDTLMRTLGGCWDGVVVAPAFFEGGRYTIHDIHWVAEGEELVPAGETEFARDRTFGYRSSNLKEWILEKGAGTIRPEQVVSISISDLRSGGVAAVRAKLSRTGEGLRYFVLNAADYADLECFIEAILEEERAGRRFLYRTAAGIPRVRCGITEKPLLRGPELALLEEGSGGLVVVGSYVPKTGRQLAAALQHPEADGIEVRVERLLESATCDAEIAVAATAADRIIAADRVALLYTSRPTEATAHLAGNLEIGKRVSDSLVAIVRRLTRTPRFLIAKGGITSSDVATHGLGIRKALVAGQLLPGLPVWECGPETRFPGLHYIVFPGNVGSDASLAEAMTILRSR